jgi:hypothetical protein
MQEINVNFPLGSELSIRQWSNHALGPVIVFEGMTAADESKS